MMKAAVARHFRQPLIIEERAVPEPGPGQVVIRMEASGLCHTDLDTVDGRWPVTSILPIVPGHEGVGIVMAVGQGVTSPSAGQRVAVPWLGYACGTCRYCRMGREILCGAQRNPGYSADGCHAEYFLAEAAFAIPVPAGLDPREAAALTCAGVTAYRAVRAGGVYYGGLVAIFGAGGDLGHLAVQYAKIAGGTVAAVETTHEALKLAAELGADILIDARAEDPALVLWGHGGADVAIGLAAERSSATTACEGLRPGGQLVLMAPPPSAAPRIPLFGAGLGGTPVIAPAEGTRTDLADVLALHADGQTRVSYQTRPLTDINHALSELLNGTAGGRLVLEPEGS